MTIRLRLAALCAAALVLTGCGAVITSPDQVTPEVYVEQPSVSPAAAKRFGDDKAEQAYQEVTKFALEQAFPEAFLDPAKKTYTAAELTAGVAPHLTPTAAQGWSSLVTLALAGDADAQDSLRILQFYNVDDPGSELPPDGDVLVRQQITDATVDVEEPSGDSPERLLVSFRHEAVLAYAEAGRPYELDVTKTMSYWLAPAGANAGSTWLIASYDGRMDVAVDS
ncbi:hypothetical protein [Georgenia yuyongxinii]|uniref:Lipoprotein n=1 Tax=Georgenia yuyongxinii TaxID=2589797 RepID=A0A552WLN4_9MICO|nr:hypothetical protein [Georgenia yuyongxinii]TRW43682.1 hypothetical protein FJ693_16740 [Georgenia yuyongxinii]